MQKSTVSLLPAPPQRIAYLTPLTLVVCGVTLALPWIHLLLAFLKETCADRLLDHHVLPDLILPSTLSVPLPLKEPVFGKKTATLLPPLPSARTIKLLAVIAALCLPVLLDISKDHLAVAPLLPLVELPLPYANGLLNAKLQLLAPRVLPLVPALKN
jgi:hypothetical protein